MVNIFKQNGSEISKNNSKIRILILLRVVTCYPNNYENYVSVYVY